LYDLKNAELKDILFEFGNKIDIIKEGDQKLKISEHEKIYETKNNIDDKKEKQNKNESKKFN
jgi:hypothetical protein